MLLSFLWWLVENMQCFTGHDLYQHRSEQVYVAATVNVEPRLRAEILRLPCNQNARRDAQSSDRSHFEPAEVCKASTAIRRV